MPMNDDQLRRALYLARRLWTVADEMEEAWSARERRVASDFGPTARTYSKNLRGPLREVFYVAYDWEREDVVGMVGHLRGKADEWAQFWADRTNENRRRTLEASPELRRVVAPPEPVAVPRAPSYLPTDGSHSTDPSGAHIRRAE